MKPTNWDNFLTLGIVVVIIFLLLQQDRSKWSEVESLKIRVQKIEERMDIFKEIANIKSEIEHIKEVRK